MADPNLELLEEASIKLGNLLDELTLVGGCAAGLLVTDPVSSPIRHTVDVDVLVEAATYTEYHQFCEKLRVRGFVQRMHQGEPVCRWRHGALVLDVMPLDESILGFSNRWYHEAMATRRFRQLPSGTWIAHIDAPHFIGTKLDAFRSRGGGDFVMSEDLEDVVVVIDGRPSIEVELRHSRPELRAHVAQGIQELLSDRLFLEALPGYFRGETNLAPRLAILNQRLRGIAASGAPFGTPDI